MDPELFFPDSSEDARQAKAVCKRCPVAEPCLEFALENQEQYGIYGGKSLRERHRIARERRQKSA